MLVVTRKVSESIVIGDNIEIIVTEIGSERVKIGIKAPRGIPVMRKELLETKDLNREAGTAASPETVDKFKSMLLRKTEPTDEARGKSRLE